MLMRSVFLSVLLALASGPVSSNSINDLCHSAATGPKKNQFLDEVSRGEMMVSSRLADLDSSNPPLQCGLARWSEPLDGESTIIAVVNADKSQILGQTKVTLKAESGGDELNGGPEDIGPGSFALFLLARGVGAIQVETTVDGQTYTSASRTMADTCPLMGLTEAIEGLKAMIDEDAHTEAAKLDILSRFRSPQVRTVAIFVEEDSLDVNNGVLIMEWDEQRTDGLGCLQ